MAIEGIVNFVKFLIEELGVFAVGATIVGLVARNLINNYFDKSVKEYQKDLEIEINEYQNKLDKELNEFQNELEKETLQYSELHSKRANVTAELYHKFVKFEDDVITLADLLERKGDPSTEEQINNAAQSGNEFLNYYMEHKILFPPEICDTIDEIVEETMRVFNEERMHMRLSTGYSSPEDFKRKLKNYKKVTEDDIPELKKQLEDHFRELLGVQKKEEAK